LKEIDFKNQEAKNFLEGIANFIISRQK